MEDRAERNRIAVNIWTARIIPVILAGIVGYATYVSVALLCVNYLIVKHEDEGAAIAILIIYFILFILMTVSFLRLVHITLYDPPYLPLGASAGRKRKAYKGKGKIKSEENGIAAGEYVPGSRSGGDSTETDISRDDPDSPGLEMFYTKDVFTCEMDGRPRYCSQCCNWKPDRTHHCSSSGRCILKMDHFCPWVGGPIGENNFKFFVLFTFYTALYCMHLLIVMAVYVHKQVTSESEQVNPHFCAILGLAGFFGLFTAGMTGTSLELIVRNETQVERLGSKTRVQTLGVLMPTAEARQPLIETLAAQAWYPTVTYPLDPDRAPPGGQFSGPVPRSDLAPLPVGTNKPTQLQQAISDDPSFMPVDDVSGSDMRSTQDEHSPRAPGGHAKPTMDPTPNLGEVRQHISPLSGRDARATRTFAVLRMRQGDNPWELGSARLNFASVMGTNIFDCLLPFRRSPCCRHENTESHFAVGPAVDELKRSVGFIDAKDMRTGRTGRRRGSNATPSTYREERPHRRRRRRRRSHKGESQDSALPRDSSGDPQIPMRDINHGEPQLRE